MTRDQTEDEEGALEHGIGLCLSGGGYRAMLFHVGAVWRLYEIGILGSVRRVSSVSAGSITAGVLGLKWNRLSFSPISLSGFVREVVAPLRSVANESVDVEFVITSIVESRDNAARLARICDAHLFGGATLQDLPEEPRFVISATNVQSGALWRFTRPYMGDHRVGRVANPTVRLAHAVAASAALLPLLSPLEMSLDDSAFTPSSGADLQHKPFTTRVVLTDGSIYDHLGLEAVWQRYQTILVSDGAGSIPAEAEPKMDWIRHLSRVMELNQNQVRSLRRRQLIDSFRPGTRKGAFMGHHH